MTRHHQAIRRQAIATALSLWSGADIQPATEAGSDALAGAGALEDDVLFHFDSGNGEICTISPTKTVGAVA